VRLEGSYAPRGPTRKTVTGEKSRCLGRRPESNRVSFRAFTIVSTDLETENLPAANAPAAKNVLSRPRPSSAPPEFRNLSFDLNRRPAASRTAGVLAQLPRRTHRIETRARFPFTTCLKWMKAAASARELISARHKNIARARRSHPTESNDRQLQSRPAQLLSLASYDHYEISQLGQAGASASSRPQSENNWRREPNPYLRAFGRRRTFPSNGTTPAGPNRARLRPNTLAANTKPGDFRSEQLESRNNRPSPTKRKMFLGPSPTCRQSNLDQARTGRTPRRCAQNFRRSNPPDLIGNVRGQTLVPPRAQKKLSIFERSVRSNLARLANPAQG